MRPQTRLPRPTPTDTRDVPASQVGIRSRRRGTEERRSFRGQKGSAEAVPGAGSDARIRSPGRIPIATLPCAPESVSSTPRKTDVERRTEAESPGESAPHVVFVLQIPEAESFRHLRDGGPVVGVDVLVKSRDGLFDSPDTLLISTGDQKCWRPKRRSSRPPSNTRPWLPRTSRRIYRVLISMGV